MKLETSEHPRSTQHLWGTFVNSLNSSEFKEWDTMLLYIPWFLLFIVLHWNNMYMYMAIKIYNLNTIYVNHIQYFK